MPYSSLAASQTVRFGSQRNSTLIFPSSSSSPLGFSWVFEMLTDCFQVVMENWGFCAQLLMDFTLYSVTLGAAFLLIKAYKRLVGRGVTFLCGRVGVCALGAATAKVSGKENMLSYYLAQLHQRQVSQEIIKEGRSMAYNGSSPLMFEWYGERYWGAAHGLAGIMHVLMDVQLNPDEAEDVKGTLRYMIKNQFPCGNYPASEDDRKRGILVHWCHGAPGIALTLVKAAEVFGDKEFLEAAAAAAEVVWNRGLLKRVGICHGISGNAYVFLSLYRTTGRCEYLYRAKAFASFLLDGGPELLFKGEMHDGYSPYSMFEGVAGMAYLFLEIVDPSQARFPGYEL